VNSISEAIPPTSSEDQQSNLHDMAKAFAWTSGGMWSTQLFTWLATFTTARLLTPADFGLVAVAYLCVGIMAEICGALGWVVIYLQELGEEQIGQLNTLVAMLGIAAFALTCLLAHAIGVFFRMPRMPMILFSMSIIFLLTAVKTIPSALLQRDCDFKSLATIESISYLAYALCTVTLALMGAGYWSLVAGLVLMSAVSTLLTLRVRRQRYYWPSRNALRYPLRFGSHMLTSSVAWYIYSNSDFMAAGRMLGQAALGAYTFAWTLASAPVDKMAKLVNRVMPSYFAAAHKDNETGALRTYLLTLAEVVSVIVLPMGVGLAIVADQFLHVALGDKWSAAVGPLRILLAYAVIRALTNILGPLLNARQQTRFTMWTNIAAAVYFPIGFLIGATWGTSGIATTWVLLYPVLAIPLFLRTFREIQLPWFEFLRALWPAFSCGILMAAALFVAREFLPAEWPEFVRLTLEVAAGTLVYGCSLLLLHPENVRRLYRIVRPANPQCI
jgi:PST family polysaccharide transporter